jgi:spermidine synthase
MVGVASANRGKRRFRALVLLLFFGSGLASLVLEVVWTRDLGTVFGNTVFAASTVLTAFMLGLALGSAVLGRVADRLARPLLLYGTLEIGVACFAFLFPLISSLTNSYYRWFYQTFDPGFGLLSAMRFVLSLAILIPPTFLMGGTLPVLGRHLGSRCREPGQEVGYLYAFNTFGAVAGSFLAGFVLLRTLGQRNTLFAAGAVALTVGALAVVFGRYSGVPDAPREPAYPKPRRKREKGHRVQEMPAAAPEPLTPIAVRLIVVGFAITGFCSLGYEVLWTRVLLFILKTSVYSFTTMLTTFLVGLALGSFVTARFFAPRMRRPLLWFGILQVLIGVAALVSVYLLRNLWAIDAGIVNRLSQGGIKIFLATRFLDAFAILLVPAGLMGAVFPVVTVACLRGESRLGARVGMLYAANTIGCVLGSFCAGFVLLPLIGSHRSLLLLATLNFALGVALIWHAVRRSAPLRAAVAAPFAAVAILAFFVTPTNVFYDTINTFHYPAKVAFVREHCAGTVSVHDLPNRDRLIAVDGVSVAGLDFMLRSTQKLQGYIPLCLHSNPQRVVQIGFGSGETARTGLTFGLPRWNLVEICPAVFEAGRFFRSINGGSYEDPRVRKIIMDGKNFALLTGEKFDIIMNDSVFPGSRGSSALYTYDHFRNCRERLAPGGFLSCWVPLDLRPSELNMILAASRRSSRTRPFGWPATASTSTR